jgi:sugar/nucleoside kinase (ribokinase family)
MKNRSVVVFGPAYLDRVLRVDRPLIETGQGPPIDQSVEGEWKFAPSGAIELVDPGGFALEIAPPRDWPGPWGAFHLARPLRAGLRGRRTVRGIAWHHDLGGMGAGYAAALGGRLYSALGAEADPTSRVIDEFLARYGVAHHALRVPDRQADWTLLVTSGEYGDKLPIGFRGCHDALDPLTLARLAGNPCDLRVVAGLPNRLAHPVLSASSARTRFFAPAMRNMTDREHSLAQFADCIDLLCCNRTEWEALEDRDIVAARVPIRAITDGPRGIDLEFTNRAGEPRRLKIPAFPRERPPRDTNRAGEAFASTLVAALLDGGWDGSSRAVDEGLVRTAAERASAAAALVLDRLDFGFPDDAEIDAAVGWTERSITVGAGPASGASRPSTSARGDRGPGGPRFDQSLGLDLECLDIRVVHVAGLSEDRSEVTERLSGAIRPAEPIVGHGQEGEARRSSGLEAAEIGTFDRAQRLRGLVEIPGSIPGHAERHLKGGLVRREAARCLRLAQCSSIGWAPGRWVSKDRSAGPGQEPGMIDRGRGQGQCRLPHGLAHAGSRPQAIEDLRPEVAPDQVGRQEIFSLPACPVSAVRVDQRAG